MNYAHTSDPEALAMINYTSGTTSNSKGVIIPYRALWSNFMFAEEVLGSKLNRGDNVISMLPLAHMYGMAFEFIFEFLHGCHVSPHTYSLAQDCIAGICRCQAFNHHLSS